MTPKSRCACRQFAIILAGGLAVAVAWVASFRQALDVHAKPSPASSLIPVQLSLGRPWLVGPPPRRDASLPANRQAGLTAAEQKRLNEVLNHMTPKARKSFARTVKRMSPEQRQKFVAYLKQRLGSQGPAR
jgi:hypothetical protein